MLKMKAQTSAIMGKAYEFVLTIRMPYGMDEIKASALALIVAQKPNMCLLD